MGNSVFQTLLKELINHGGSDLHLSRGCKPSVRLHGDLVELNAYPEQSHEDLESIVSYVLSDKQLEQFYKQRSYDLGFSSEQEERFRINIYFENGSLAFAIRWLNGRIFSFEEMNLPEQLNKLPKLNDGLVLMTGATGSGKSTTLAAVVNTINETRPCHILTIEDPIEFLHKNKKAIVHQRELGNDVPSFADAMRGALREDPDVVLVGEMRDLETMRAALMVAETGHLVFSTLHTNDAVGVIDRMISAFPAGEQANVRAQLAMVLRVVITQQLVKSINNDSRVPINEILWINHAVAHLIREHKSEQIRSIMETSKDIGNMTLEHAIANRIANNEISEDLGLALTSRQDQVKELVNIIKNKAHVGAG